MKSTIFTTLALIALTACGQPMGDPSSEIMETSKGVVGKMVTLKTTPSLKSGSLIDAAREWRAMGWSKVVADACKDVDLPFGQPIEAYEVLLPGVASQNVPTYNLRICATQLSNPKAISAIGYVVSTQKAEQIKL